MKRQNTQIHRATYILIGLLVFLLVYHFLEYQLTYNPMYAGAFNSPKSNICKNESLIFDLMNPELSTLANPSDKFKSDLQILRECFSSNGNLDHLFELNTVFLFIHLISKNDEAFNDTIQDIENIGIWSFDYISNFAFGRLNSIAEHIFRQDPLEKFCGFIQRLSANDQIKKNIHKKLLLLTQSNCLLKTSSYLKLQNVIKELHKSIDFVNSQPSGLLDAFMLVSFHSFLSMTDLFLGNLQSSHKNVQLMTQLADESIKFESIFATFKARAALILLALDNSESKKQIESSMKALESSPPDSSTLAVLIENHYVSALIGLINEKNVEIPDISLSEEFQALYPLHVELINSIKQSPNALSMDKKIKSLKMKWNPKEPLLLLTEISLMQK